MYILESLSSICLQEDFSQGSKLLIIFKVAYAFLHLFTQSLILALFNSVIQQIVLCVNSLPTLSLGYVWGPQFKFFWKVCLSCSFIYSFNNLLTLWSLHPPLQLFRRAQILCPECLVYSWFDSWLLRRPLSWSQAEGLPHRVLQKDGCLFALEEIC